MINSALTLNQNPFAGASPPPPNGLVGLLARPGLEIPKAVTGEVTSWARRRRISSVISSEPIQMRRVWSILMTRASAFSCSGVPTRAGPGVAEDGAGATDEKPDDEKRGRSG